MLCNVIAIGFVTHASIGFAFNKLKVFTNEMGEDQKKEAARSSLRNKTKADKPPKPKAAAALSVDQETPSNEPGARPIPKVKPKAKPNPKPKASRKMG